MLPRGDISLSQDTFNRLPTVLLFQQLNEKRLATQQPTLENALLASKLGILIAVKTDKYVNFRHEVIELTSKQVNALSSILDEYFNVNMHQEIREMLIKPSLEKLHSESELLIKENPDSANSSFLGKIKRFFGRKRAE